MAGGNAGVARVDDEGDAHRDPGLADEFGAVRGGAGGERGAGDVGEGHAGFFKDGALCEDAGAAAAALGAGPFVGAKSFATIFLGQGGADAVLEIEQVAFDGGEIGGGGHRVE